MSTAVCFKTGQGKKERWEKQYFRLGLGLLKQGQKILLHRSRKEEKKEKAVVERQISLIHASYQQGGGIMWINQNCR